jgi:multiple sugar transport system substrate-binding protein
MVKQGSKVGGPVRALAKAFMVFFVAWAPQSGAETIIAGRDVPGALHIVMWKYHLVGQESYYRALVDSYEKANPGHHVVVDLEDWPRAHDELHRWMARGAGPDLTVVPDVWLAEFASGLVAYPEKMPAAFIQGFSGVMLERSRLNGHNLGLVWAASTKALFYRKDLFEQAGITPPTNWVELQHAAEKLSDPPRHYGLAVPGAARLDTADNFYLFLWSNGGQLLTPDHRSLLDTNASVEALTFLQNLSLKYHVTEPRPGACDRPCAEELFAQGKAAMVETGPWLINTIAAQPRPVPFSVVPLPAKKNAVTQLVTDHLVLLKSSQKQAEALRFITFAYERDWRLQWARLGMVPELRSVETDPLFMHDPIWQVFVSQLSNARWIPLVPWEPVDAAISSTLSRVLAGEAAPAPALRALSMQINVLFRK